MKRAIKEKFTLTDIDSDDCFFLNGYDIHDLFRLFIQTLDKEDEGKICLDLFKQM